MATNNFTVNGAPTALAAGQKAQIAVTFDNPSGLAGDYTLTAALVKSGTQTPVASMSVAPGGTTGDLAPGQSATVTLATAQAIPDAQTAGASLDVILTLTSQALQQNSSYTIAGAFKPATMQPPTNIQTSNVTSTSFEVSWAPDPLAAQTIIQHTNASGGVLGVLATTSADTAEITGLTSGYPEHFSLVSVDVAGNKSSASAVLNVTTEASGGGGGGTPVYPNQICSSLSSQMTSLESTIRSLQAQLASVESAYATRVNYDDAHGITTDTTVYQMGLQIDSLNASIASDTQRLQSLSSQMQAAGCF